MSPSRVADARIYIDAAAKSLNVTISFAGLGPYLQSSSSDQMCIAAVVAMVI